VVSVQQPQSFIEPLILKRAGEALALLGSSATVDPSRVVVDDSYIGAGYGIASEGSMAALATAGRTAGLVLDPAYSGKALHGLIGNLKSGRIASDAKVVFIHTGGAPGLFARADIVAPALAS
jgi:1-aminocyclopropane-1-carboxylate deaminase/D-cysteine desulfhydrase-like pyridoxal-dependent ACC family enzyme